QGSWTVTSALVNGKPEVEIQGGKFLFKDGKLTLRARDQVIVELSCKVDPTKKPRAIDLTFTREGKEETALGIYELEGDVLKLCLRKPTEKGRPTEFASKDETIALIELKRDKM